MAGLVPAGNFAATPLHKKEVHAKFARAAQDRVLSHKEGKRFPPRAADARHGPVGSRRVQRREFAAPEVTSPVCRVTFMDSRCGERHTYHGFARWTDHVQPALRGGCGEEVGGDNGAFGSTE